MTERTMVHFPIGADRLFNYRVAAVAIRDGYVLLCREDDDDYVMLPGGRVELGESTLVALRREIAEELRAPAEIGRLLFTVEDFFRHRERDVHELSAYYLIALSDTFPFNGAGRAMEVEDEGHLLQFDWVPTDEVSLRRYNLRPSWIIPHLASLPQETRHLIVEEGR
jgi:ADP-ribose pyrophosphatase YjhB (NUDIX family)